jgi:Homing endonuclease associated repeat
MPGVKKFTERQLRVIVEIQRVAEKLGVDRLSQDDFDTHHELTGVSTAGYQFGSWNRAVKAAGLEPYEPGPSNTGPKISDEELLLDILHVHRQLGKKPSEREMARFGRYSPKPYKDRWGSWVAARAAAYNKYGDPEHSLSGDETDE